MFDLIERVLCRLEDIHGHLISMTETLRIHQHRQNQILAAIRNLSRKEAQTMATVDDILVDVQENTDATSSAIQLLQNLSQQIKDAGTDPAKLAQISAALDANTAALASAVIANTPSTPAPPEDAPAA